MYILHIESSTSVCSVALSQGEQVLAWDDRSEGMNHAALLAPQIKALLDAATVKPGELAAISVSSGPGSYTGLRVGSSTAKGMAYSLGIPILSVPTLFALGQAALERFPEASWVLPMIDARRREVYAALYDATMHEIWPVSSVILDDDFSKGSLPAEGLLIGCGDGALKAGILEDKGHQVTLDTTLVCSARHLVKPAIDLFHRGIHHDPLHFVPYYHKPPNITTPRKEGSVGF